MPLVEPQERKSRWYQSYNNNSKIYVQVEMFDPYLWEMDWQSIKTNDSFTDQASACLLQHRHISVVESVRLL